MIMISMSQIASIVKEKELGYKNQMRVSGLDLKAYWLSKYLSDVVFLAIPSALIVILIPAFKVLLMDDFWILLVLNAFGNPVFIYFLSTFFNNAASSRSAVMYMYLLLGIVIPLSLFITIF